jgi:hypothetical protein
MAITQGDPLPDITKTTTTEQQAPDYYTDYLTDLSKAGETALDLTGADLIEGYDPLQTTGYGMVEDAAGSYGDLMDLAETTGNDLSVELMPQTSALSSTHIKRES